MKCYAPHRTASDIADGGVNPRCAPLTMSEVNPDDGYVLQINRDFVCLNKPPDVRMDGEFDVTIEKLIRHWLVNKYHLPPDTKWVHQLDFSTSGCLLIALHRAAANLASRAFENRKTQKEYVAVVEGHLTPPDNVPTYANPLPEVHYKAAKATKRKIGDAATTWQDRVLRNNVTTYHGMMSSLAASQGDSEEYRRLSAISADTLYVNSRLRKQVRKYLKSKGLTIPDAADESPLNADTSSDSAVTPRSPISDDPPHPPVIYRLLDDPAQVFYVSMSIAEVPGSFLMEAGRRCNPGQWSQTRVELLRLCTYANRPVSKLLLTPLTGRRHQLRVLCLNLGHPIVGDATYCPAAMEEICAASCRMMLHAHRLNVHLASTEGLLDTTSADIHLETDDPFTLSAHNEIKPKLPYFVKERS